MLINTGTLKRIPGDGRSLFFSLAGLNVRECEASNWEYVMKFLKGVQACRFLVKILEHNPESVFFFFEFAQFWYVFIGEVCTYG